MMMMIFCVCSYVCMSDIYLANKRPLRTILLYNMLKRMGVRFVSCVYVVAIIVVTEYFSLLRRFYLSLL